MTMLTKAPCIASVMAVFVRRSHGLKACAVLTAVCFGVYVLFFRVVDHSGSIPSEAGPLLGRVRTSVALHKVSVNQERLDHLQHTCRTNGTQRYISNRNKLETLDLFLVDNDHQLLYCYIPKIGSSTMKRLFSILRGSNNGLALFNMSGRFIHRRAGAYSTVGKDMKAETFLRKFHVVQTFTKIMFVRDPYERLFSAFVDRLFGASENLQSLSPIIMKSLRPKSCDGLNLTFTHVIEYVTKTTPFLLDEHFRPYYVDCFPCHLSYDYIGKLETFRDDVRNILASVGMDSRTVLGDDKQFDTQSEMTILRDVGARAFEMMTSPYYKQCFTMYRMLKRTWVSFQVRGFIPIEASFPIEPNKAQGVTKEQFQKLVKDTYLKVTDRSAVKKQRGMAMKEAFYNLPRSLMHKLQGVVQRDCDLFGYQCSVDWRFSESERPTPVFHFDKL